MVGDDAEWVQVHATMLLRLLGESHVLTVSDAMCSRLTPLRMQVSTFLDLVFAVELAVEFKHACVGG